MKYRTTERKLTVKRVHNFNTVGTRLHKKVLLRQMQKVLKTKFRLDFS